MLRLRNKILNYIINNNNKFIFLDNKKKLTHKR